ncbi:Hsp20/alpha crystallin family protein [Ruminococcus sp. 5_1_39BFAA]|uniref:Hsp20/alpha crystallin family protein n=1 Tax=Ruminococcus sp. 5_1_39BFAA TaxID=457412 RepID=UPI0035660723
MLMPSIFGEDLFDDLMDFSFPRTTRVIHGGNTQNVMRTDVKETDQGYELDIDLPGFKKEDVKVQLKNGYLNIQAAQNRNNDQKDEDGKYIRRERFSGAVSRSFYVGEKVTEGDIHAKFENGILKLTLPKAENRKVEQENCIAIEG